MELFHENGEPLLLAAGTSPLIENKMCFTIVTNTHHYSFFEKFLLVLILDGEIYSLVPHELPLNVLYIIKHFQFAHQPFETSMNAIQEYPKRDKERLLKEKQRLEEEKVHIANERDKLNRERRELLMIKNRIAALL